MGPDHSLLGLIMIALASAGLALGFLRRSLLAWIWVGSMATGILPIVTRSFVFNRFYAYALPGFFLFAALAPALLLERARKSARALGAVLFALGLAMVSIGTIGYFSHDKQPYKKVAAWVKTNASDSRILTFGRINEYLIYYFPTVVVLNESNPVDPTFLKGATVVLGYPNTLGNENKRALQLFCRPPIIFPSCLSKEMEVHVYQCE